MKEKKYNHGKRPGGRTARISGQWVYPEIMGMLREKAQKAGVSQSTLISKGIYDIEVQHCPHCGAGYLSGHEEDRELLPNLNYDGICRECDHSFFAETLAEYRDRHGLTPSQFAKKLGVSTNLYESWESFTEPPTIEQAFEIGEVTNLTCSVAYKLEKVLLEEKG